jgi:hypothetical protein
MCADTTVRHILHSFKTHLKISMHRCYSYTFTRHSLTTGDRLINMFIVSTPALNVSFDVCSSRKRSWWGAWHFSAADYEQLLAAGPTRFLHPLFAPSLIETGEVLLWVRSLLRRWIDLGSWLRGDRLVDENVLCYAEQWDWILRHRLR